MTGALRRLGSDCVRLGLAGAWLGAVVGLPPTLGRLAEPGWLLRPSAEAVALIAALAALAALGRPPGRRLIAVLALGLLALTLLGAADLLVHEVYDRPLNLALDLAYVPFLTGFLAESAGPVRLGAAAAGAAALAAALLAGNVLALRTVSGVVAHRRGRLALAGLAALALAVQAARAEAVGAGCPAGSGLACRSWQLVGDQVDRALDFWRPLPGLDDRPDPHAAPRPGLLAGLRGADVVIAFVESYGRTALDRPAYRAVVGPALAAAEADLARRGLAAVSGYLASPTVGGLSWLAHGTLLGGVWLPDDLYYKRLVTGERTTLVDDFDRAGYRTLGVFPQMDGAWPEGAFFGHDEVYTAREIPYAGPPFGWVRIPDQYSLAFIERERRRGRGGDAGGGGRTGPPVFVELALVSSHAPWEPVPPLIDDWAALADGAGEVLRGHGGEGGPENWPHDAAANYPKAIAYALRALGSYALTFLAGDDPAAAGGDEDGGRAALLVILGDHQPASLITGGDGASREVPIHVVATDPDLLEPFRAWGFVDGMRPGPGAASHRMDRFRAWFLEAFSGRDDAGDDGRALDAARAEADPDPGPPVAAGDDRAAARRMRRRLTVRSRRRRQLGPPRHGVTPR